MSSMDRLRQSRFMPRFGTKEPHLTITQNNDITQKPAGIARALGRIGLHNAALGNMDGTHLSVGVMRVIKGDFSDGFREVLRSLKTLKDVSLQTPMQTAVCVPRLLLQLTSQVDDQLNSIAETATNPTLWFRQPYALLLLVAPDSMEAYKNELRGILMKLIQRIAMLPLGIRPECCIVCGPTKGPSFASDAESEAKVFDKMSSDFKICTSVKLETSQKSGSISSASTLELQAAMTECIRVSFAARVQAYQQQVQALQTSADGPVSHLMHLFLVNDALALMLERAQLLDAATREIALMEASYASHAARHPYMHSTGVQPERDFKIDVKNMDQTYLKHALLVDGRLNSFCMLSYIFGTQMRLAIKVSATRPSLGTLPKCAQRAVGFLSEMASNLVELRDEGALPELFPPLWIAATTFRITLALWNAHSLTSTIPPLSSALEDFDAVMEWGPQVPMDRLVSDLRAMGPCIASVATEVGGVAGGDSSMGGGSSDGGRSAGSSFATSSARPYDKTRTATVPQNKLFYKTIADLYCMAYKELIGVANALRLTCPLHPVLADVQLLVPDTCTTLKRASSTESSVELAPATTPREPAPDPRKQANCRTATMIWDSESGSIKKEDDIYMDPRLLELKQGRAVPPWIKAGTWFAVLSNPEAHERMVCSLTCATSWCYLQAGHVRHSLLMTGFTANFLLRQGELALASKLWWEVASLQIHQGWRRLAIPCLDNLLLASQLYSSPLAAPAAVMMLDSSAADLKTVFPRGTHTPDQIYECASHILRGSSEPDDLNLSTMVAVNLRKSQASMFFGEATDGNPDLRPPAAWPGDQSESGAQCAQLTGMADVCHISVCVTSRMPVPLHVQNLTLELANLVYQPSTPGTLDQFPEADSALRAQHDPSDSQPLQSDMPLRLESQQSHMSMASLCDRPLRQDSFSSYTSSFIRKRRLRTQAYHGSQEEQLPTKQVSLFSKWSTRNYLTCNLVDSPTSSAPPGHVTLVPGDNMLTFKAFPLLEGLYVFETVEATVQGPVEHRISCEAVIGDPVQQTVSLEEGLDIFGAVGGALVATGSEDHLQVTSVLAEGALLEGHHQWVGLCITAQRHAIKQLSLRVTLRVDDNAVPLAFASACRRTGGGGDDVEGADETSEGELNALVLWQCDASQGECVSTPVKDGEVIVPDDLVQDRAGVLWVPLACVQLPRVPETIDISNQFFAGSSLTPALEKRADSVDKDYICDSGCLELALTYHAGCHRSKHLRVPLPVQEVFSYVINAQPLSNGLIALQLTQSSHLKYPISILSYTLELQTGLQLSDAHVTPSPPPITLHSLGTNGAVFLLQQVPSDGTRRSIDLGNPTCRIITTYTVAKDTLLDTTFILKGTPPGPSTGTADVHAPSKAPVSSAPHAATDFTLLAQGKKLDDETPHDAASVGTHTHTFFLETSSFLLPAMSSVSMMTDGDADRDDVLPVITFMGPASAAVGKAVTLRWHVAMTSFTSPEDGVEEPHTSTPSSDDDDIMYELIMPSTGWEKARKPKGHIRLNHSAGAYATVEVDLVPTLRGFIVTPILRIFPRSLPPMTGGQSQLNVS